jgi:hypothetical protein
MGLCELLPKLSKYKNPPLIDKENLPRYSVNNFFLYKIKNLEIHKRYYLFHKEISRRIFGYNYSSNSKFRAKIGTLYYTKRYTNSKTSEIYQE